MSLSKQHDFLWRFRPHLPAPGAIAVFNRSWYVDVGVVTVHGLAAPEVIEERYGLINVFESRTARALRQPRRSMDVSWCPGPIFGPCFGTGSPSPPAPAPRAAPKTEGGR